MRSRTRGMTLLELLVALVLLAAISTALLSATGMGIRTFERAEQLADQDNGIVTRLQLRRWLRSAASPGLLTQIETDFVGSQDGFEFTTLLPSGHAPSAAALRISVERQEQDIVVRIDELNDQSEVESTLTRTLDVGSSDLSFRYLQSDGIEPIWRSEWSEDLQLPLAVRVEAETSTSWALFLVSLAHARP